MKARLYSFHSRWNLEATPDEVWQVLTATPFSWQAWWPELTSLEVLKADPQYVGTVFACIWRAKSGYKLHATFTITAVEKPRVIKLTSDGDLLGSSEWIFTSPANGITRLNITWKARTTKRWMNWLAPVLGPIFLSNHDAIMRSGQAGLQQYLKDYA